ncbi:hypothetical protein QUB37_29260, partial [Microcoleus sp. AT3-A2]|uniref:hypothetical protein n=1 Tax=Microcoleus sp. AT3-A2 TaxID=2818610 RepID=UPI002FD068F8
MLFDRSSKLTKVSPTLSLETGSLDAIASSVSPQIQARRSTPQPNPTTPSVQRAVNEDKTVSTQLENRIQNAT